MCPFHKQKRYYVKHTRTFLKSKKVQNFKLYLAPRFGIKDCPVRVSCLLTKKTNNNILPFKKSQPKPWFCTTVLQFQRRQGFSRHLPQRTKSV